MQTQALLPLTSEQSHSLLLQLPQPSPSLGSTPNMYLLLFYLCFHLYNCLCQVARHVSKAMERRKYTEVSTQTDREGTDGAIEQQTTEEPPKKAKDISWMLGNSNHERLVWSTTVHAVPPSANEVSSKEAAELLCSYSWKGIEHPTIYVPGTPATYAPPEFTVIGEKDGVEITEPIQLPEDSGSHWVDQHADKAPLQQFEPFLQAVATMKPEFRINKVKVVVNRSSLMQLHSSLKGKLSQAFNLELKMINDTLFIERKVRNADYIQ
jgi:hypothetical protein